MKQRHIPEKLLELLTEKRMTKCEAAFRANVDLARFSRISNGWLRPTPRERENIAAVFGEPAENLFPGDMQDAANS